MSRGGKAFLAGLVVGALAGAVAGVLLAPRTGKETRDGLMGGVTEMGGPGPELLLQVGRQVGDAVRRRFEIGRAAFVEGKEEARLHLEHELSRAQGGSP